ncbi:MAG: hypothetical protein ACLU84_03880 [Clostridia bacterium]
MKKKTPCSVQDWLPFDSILDNGIIQLKDKTYLKILKVIPINYHLKSQFEKEAILNSYKIFLKTCSFPIQILIQSNKEDLNKNISKIKSQEKLENEKIKQISENYITYIKELNQTKKSSNKNFYMIIKNSPNEEKLENILIEELNDQFFKIKEALSRCGNIVFSINKKEEIKKILFSFLNNRMYFKMKNEI